MSNLSNYVVRDNNGSADMEATVSKFRADLDAYLAARSEKDAKIANAVNAVFDKYRGARINVPAVQNFALTELGAGAGEYTELSEAIHSYLKDNSGEGGLFKITKGKGGGCSRVSDEKPEAK